MLCTYALDCSDTIVFTATTLLTSSAFRFLNLELFSTLVHRKFSSPHQIETKSERMPAGKNVKRFTSYKLKQRNPYNIRNQKRVGGIPSG